MESRPSTSAQTKAIMAAEIRKTKEDKKRQVEEYNNSDQTTMTFLDYDKLRLDILQYYSVEGDPDKENKFCLSTHIGLIRLLDEWNEKRRDEDTEESANEKIAQARKKFKDDDEVLSNKENDAGNCSSVNTSTQSAKSDDSGGSDTSNVTTLSDSQFSERSSESIVNYDKLKLWVKLYDEDEVREYKFKAEDCETLGLIIVRFLDDRKQKCKSLIKFMNKGLVVATGDEKFKYDNYKRDVEILEADEFSEKYFG